MNVIYKIFAFLMLIAIKINENSASYIYQEINQSLASVKQINFSMFMKNLNGVVLYAVDHSDRILIELEKVNGGTEMVYTNNKHSIRRNIHSICGCSECSYIYMEWRIELIKRRPSVTCGNVTQDLITVESRENTNKILAYPLPKNYDTIRNQTFIMIGNIGPFEGNTGIVYNPLRNQLVGCLYKLYINGSRILFNSKGSIFNSSCFTDYTETICGPKYCNESSVTYKITDCSISVLNRRYCTSDLHQFFGNQSHYLNGNLQFARLDWLIDVSEGPSCLIEFEMGNGYFIAFHTSYLNLYVDFIHNSRVHYHIPKLLHAKSTETMVVEFTGKNVIIKLSSGEDIKTYSHPIASEPIFIRIGSFFKTKYCKTFQGRINFQKKMKQITSKSSLEINSTIPSKSKIIIAIIISVTSFVFLFFILLILSFYIITQRKTVPENTKIIFRASNPISRSQLELPRSPYANVYELENELVCVSNQDSEGYEILPDKE